MSSSSSSSSDTHLNLSRCQFVLKTLCYSSCNREYILLGADDGVGSPVGDMNHGYSSLDSAPGQDRCVFSH